MTSQVKKVTLFLGTPRKGATYQAVQEFVANLNTYTEIDWEYVCLNDYNLNTGKCKGCKLCFNKGEEYCSFNDDRDLLLEIMNNSDGVVLATPNYSFQVTALMKNFIDRLSFVLHRPRFFGKALTVIVAQGVFGGSSIVKYLESVGGDWGFQVVKGCCLTAIEPRTVVEQEKITQEIKKAAARFYKGLMRPTLPAPSFFRLFKFRISRTMMMGIQDETYRDYRYYKEKGWDKSDYYYDVSLGFIKKLTGRFIDYLGNRMVAKRKTMTLVN